MLSSTRILRLALGAALILPACWPSPVAFGEAAALTQPVVRTVQAPAGCFVPDVAVDPKGVLHMVYALNRNAWYIRSTDNGATFSQPVQVNSEGTVGFTMGERGPKLSVGGDGVIHVVWSNIWSPGVQTFAYYARSLDGGKTFEKRKLVSSMDAPDGLTMAADGASRVLPPYPEDLSKKAESSLIRVGVRPYTGVRVVGIDESGVSVEYADGRTERLAARTVIWAAGVRASAFGEILARRAGATLEKGGRVVVGPDLSLPGYPEIFVIGDLAYCTGEQGHPLPGVAQVAMQQGSYVATLIGRRTRGASGTKPFQYRDRGDLAVIGRAAAVARIGGLHLSGFLAWLIWLFVHLMYLVEFSNRLLVFIHWGFLYLTFNRGARLITGEGPEES
jgi:hypothetical protein